MKKILFFGILLFSGIAWSQTVYVPVDNPKAVTFSIRNLGVTVQGSFSGLAGEIHFDPAHPEAASFQVRVNSSSVNTGIDLRDKHLRKEDFLDVEKNPRIEFTSSGVNRGEKKDIWVAKGKLTLKGVTREVFIPFEVEQRGMALVFSGEFKLNRRDFGVGGRNLGMSEEVTVKLRVTANRQSPL